MVSLLLDLVTANNHIYKARTGTRRSNTVLDPLHFHSSRIPLPPDEEFQKEKHCKLLTNIVHLAKVLCDIGAKLLSNATGARTPSWQGLRICPEQFRHQSAMSWLTLGNPVNVANLFQCHIISRAQSTMDNKDLFL